MHAGRFAFLALTSSLFLAACGGSSQEQAEPTLAPPPPPPPPPPAEAPAPAAAAPNPAPPPPMPKTLEVPIQAKSGSKLVGKVNLTEVEGGVKVNVSVTGAKPGDHGMHVHQKADCSAPDAKSAGDHFNPQSHPHGLPPGEGQRHLGDMGNLTVGPDGTGSKEIVVQGANLKAEDPMSFLGRALIIHEKKDDGGQPTGNAGNRVGCAELTELQQNVAPPADKDKELKENPPGPKAGEAGKAAGGEKADSSKKTDAKKSGAAPSAK